jgi:hypothetical protein
MHYVAVIKVLKVVENKPTTSYPRNDPPPKTKTVAQLMNISLKSSDRQKLLEKVAQHLDLIDDDDEIADVDGN